MSEVDEWVTDQNNRRVSRRHKKRPLDIIENEIASLRPSFIKSVREVISYSALLEKSIDRNGSAREIKIRNDQLMNVYENMLTKWNYLSECYTEAELEEDDERKIFHEAEEKYMICTAKALELIEEIISVMSPSERGSSRASSKSKKSSKAESSKSKKSSKTESCKSKEIDHPSIKQTPESEDSIDEKQRELAKIVEERVQFHYMEKDRELAMKKLSLEMEIQAHETQKALILSEAKLEVLNDSGISLSPIKEDLKPTANESLIDKVDSVQTESTSKRYCDSCTQTEDLLNTHCSTQTDCIPEKVNSCSEIEELSESFDNCTQTTDGLESCYSSCQTHKAGHVFMTGSKSSNSRKVQTVCKFYKKNICWHGKKGTDCKFEHPQMCVRYMKHGNTASGCTKGRSCNYLHPILCKYAVRYGACYKIDCTFTHIKGTLRCKNNIISKEMTNLRYEAQDNTFNSSYMFFQRHLVENNWGNTDPMNYTRNHFAATHGKYICPSNLRNMQLRNNGNTNADGVNVGNPYVPNFSYTSRVNRENCTPLYYLGPDT